MNIKTLPSIAIIGSGRVANAIGVLFKSKGIQIESVHSRNQDSGQALSSKLDCSFSTKIESAVADILLICVSDDAIHHVIKNIPQHQKVLYTAGSVELNSLDHEKCGVFYPLQTFTDKDHSLGSHFPMLLEAHQESLMNDMILLCVQSGLHFEKCSSERRKQYHLVAVLLNNFVNHLVYLSQEEANKRGLSWEVLEPLMEKTFASIMQSKAKEIQTGPARRGDIKIIAKHQDMLDDSTKKIYQQLSESILNTYKDEL
jgi:predicted short-subunit dehydrogenase-like oxidoreductase (DUF2520 family)